MKKNPIMRIFLYIVIFTSVFFLGRLQGCVELKAENNELQSLVTITNTLNDSSLEYIEALTLNGKLREQEVILLREVSAKKDTLINLLTKEITLLKLQKNVP